MKEPAIKKTNIATIVFALLTAVAVYFGVPDKSRPPLARDHPADGVATFFDAAVIKWIIPNNPGGGYDEYARLIAPYLEKYTGARLQLSNIPGSGGMRALSELFKSPADGLTIALINGGGMVTNQVAEVNDTDNQISELSFLGRVVDDIRVLTISTQSVHSSFADIMNAPGPVKIGATGFGGSTYVDAVISRELFDLNMKVIHGFNNSSAMRHAMLRSNIDGAWSSWGSVIDEVDSGRIRIVLQGGNTRAANLPDVPTIFEFLDKTPDPLLTQKILTTWNDLHLVGRIAVAPPGIPAGRLRFLRQAFRKALHDTQFLDDAEKARRPVNFASGEEVDSIVMNALAVPAETQQVFIKSVQSELQ